MNPDQSLADAQNALKEATLSRDDAEHRFLAAKAACRMRLVARRAAGEKLTEKDMDALIELAIDNEDDVRNSYLSHVQAESAYLDAKAKAYLMDKTWWEGRRNYNAP